MKTLVLDSQKRSLKLKTLDYFLYFATFGGITFISGSIVHALEFSLYSVFLLLIGVIISPAATILRDRWSTQKPESKPKDFETYFAMIITSVSAGIVGGGILHWQESPRFGLYLVVSGLIMSLSSSFLYKKGTIKSILTNYLLSLAMFSGISFISGSVVHAMNAWFSNFTLIFVGILLTPGALIIKQIKSNTDKKNLVGDILILVFLSLGIGGITGGILHFEVNVAYALKLIIGGFIISFTTALFKNNGSLADLRD